MMPKPLDLKVKEIINKFGYDEGLDLSPLAENIGFAFNDSMKELIKEIKQRVRSACEFYLMFKDKPELLNAVYPDLKEWIDRKGWVFSSDYNEWLFRLAFKDVLAEEVVKNE